MMRRFAVVKHDCKTNGRLCAHHLFTQYHYRSLDSDHVLVLGHVSTHRIHDLDGHEHVLLLPSLFSSKPIVHHADERKKAGFCLPLREHLSLLDHHTTWDVAEMAYSLHGRIFALDV